MRHGIVTALRYGTSVRNALNLQQGFVGMDTSIRMWAGPDCWPLCKGFKLYLYMYLYIIEYTYNIFVYLDLYTYIQI